MNQPIERGSIPLDNNNNNNNNNIATFSLYISNVYFI